MKQIALALATLAMTGMTSVALAGPHCPPGQDNVWGACIDRGSGIFNGLGHHGRRSAAATNHSGYKSEPTCKPPQISVWGACVNRPQW